MSFVHIEAENNVQLDQEIVIEDIQNKIVHFFQKEYIVFLESAIEAYKGN